MVKLNVLLNSWNKQEEEREIANSVNTHAQPNHAQEKTGAGESKGERVSRGVHGERRVKHAQSATRSVEGDFESETKEKRGRGRGGGIVKTRKGDKRVAGSSEREKEDGWMEGGRECVVCRE